MGSPLFDPADLDEVVEVLRLLTVDGRPLSVDLDPAKVTAPGVWVRWREAERETLASTRLGLDLYLVVGDTEVRPSITGLGALLDVVAPVVDTWGGPTGPVRHVALAMPDGTLPALQLPLDVSTSGTPAP